MAIREIVKIGDEVLRKKAREVTRFDARLHTLLDDMKETLVEADGAGLAAPQVGVLRRAVVVLVDGEWVELVNPAVIKTSGKQEGLEGCLSVPGRWGIVRRPMQVSVRAQDRNGNWFEKTGDGLMARAFCHEIDHLDGTLFVDLATRMLTPEELERESK